MRALAREIAFKKIYESMFNENSNDDLQLLFDIDNLTDDNDKMFVSTLVELYFNNKNEVDNLINKLLVDYSPERIFRIDRAIISLATVELKYYKQTPLAVVINEAVNLAKKYGTDKSYAFVNGILKSISKEI